MVQRMRLNDDPEVAIAGAEYLSGEELATQAGFWLEFAERMSDIHQQQLDWLMADWEQSAQRLLRADAPGDVALDHASRRVRHCMDGAAQMLELWRKEVDRSMDAHRKLWAPFLRSLTTSRDG